MTKAMKKITVTVSENVAADLAKLAQRCSRVARKQGAMGTDCGEVTVAQLLAILAEDAAMVIWRPGSWEGAGMARQLAGHGYDLGLT
jgi:3-phosphoglycerate kinase